MSRANFADVRFFGELDSTNRYLLDEARSGAPEGLVAVADHQSGGRGRLGRRWESAPGASLLVSVLVRPDLPVDRLFLCSVVVALSTADACTAVAGVAPEMKWPNDLMVGERKLAGVLAEVEMAPTGAVVVGVGVNVSGPGPQGVPSIPLEEAGGRPVERRALLEAFLDRLSARRATLAEDVQSGRLADEHRRRCATLGRTVRVELPGEVIEGRADDLTDEGHLLVVTGDGRREVQVGDVIHLRPGATG